MVWTSFARKVLTDYRIMRVADFSGTTNGHVFDFSGKARRKGRVVVVGTVGLNIPRDIYYTGN